MREYGAPHTADLATTQIQTEQFGGYHVGYASDRIPAQRQMLQIHHSTQYQWAADLGDLAFANVQPPQTFANQKQPFIVGAETAQGISCQIQCVQIDSRLQ